MDVIKPIKVVKAGEKPSDQWGISDIKTFAAYPNPSNGKFYVDVELSKHVCKQTCFN